MTFFLKIKHWQLFGLQIGLPIIIQAFAMGQMITNQNSTAMIYAFPLLMVIYVTFFFGWFYSLGTNLYKKIPQGVQMNIGLFKLFLLIPATYMLLLTGFMGLMISNTGPGQVPSPWYFALMIPLHLFSMFCIFYCLYFNAKTLKTVELQREVHFNDYAGEFFLIWFFPLGVWFIQPRINELFKND